MKRLRMFGIALSLVILIGACGGKEEKTPTVAPTSPPAPTIAPTATSAPAAIASATPAAVATATPVPTRPAAIRDTTLVVALDTLERELWLLHYGGSTMFNPRHAMFEELAVWTPRYVEARLAESWTLSPDSKTFTMKLRKGIKFHDGKELDSADVIKTYDLLYNKEASHAGLSTVRPLFGQNQEEFRQRQSVRAVDKYTVEMSSKIPYAQWIETIVGPVSAPFLVVNSAQIEKVGVDEAAAKPVGTGPFKIVEHRRGQNIKVEAVQPHWRQTSSIRFVDYQIIPEYATQLALVATARADIINLSAAQVAQAKRVGARIVVDDAGYNVWYQLRGQIPPDHANYDGSLPWVDGKDPDRAKKVRLAMNLAIDRQGIIDKLYGGLGQVSGIGACTFPGQPWYEGIQPYPYDLARAKALLAEAGYANGFDLEIAIFDQASGPVGGDLLHNVVADQWKQAGVRTKAVAADFTVFREILLKIQQPKLAYYWYCNFSDPDPMRYYNFFYHKANPVWFGSEALEPMLDKANAGLTNQERLEPIRAINRYFRDGNYFVPMFVLPKLYATSARLDKWPLVSGHLRVHNVEYMTLKD